MQSVSSQSNNQILTQSYVDDNEESRVVYTEEVEDLILFMEEGAKEFDTSIQSDHSYLDEIFRDLIDRQETKRALIGEGFRICKCQPTHIKLKGKEAHQPTESFLILLVC